MPKTTILWHMIYVCMHYRNGSTNNRTVREAEMLAAIRNRLYFCSAFGTQVHNIEY